MIKRLILLTFILLMINIFALVYIFYTESFETKLRYANESEDYEKPFIIDNLLSSQQCSAIIEQSKPNLEDSKILSGKDSQIRNSRQTWIKKDDPLVKDLFTHISNKFKIPIENAEDLQVVNYKPDQYYREHHDSCCDDNDTCKNFVTRGGQRILTVLIYLNDEFTDGGTHFPNLNTTIKPNKGSAVVFRPLAKNSNSCHVLALHAGLPVSSGEKWIANLWFREKTFV